MISEALLSLLASIDDAGGLTEVKNSGGMSPELKLICDKQTYDILLYQLMGLITPISENKAKGLCFIIEVGELN